MVTKTQNELLNELRNEMNDRFRIVAATVIDINNELAKLSNEIEKFKSAFRLLGGIPQDEEVFVDEKIYNITEARKHLREIFGRRLISEDFMEPLVEMGFIRKYCYQTSAGYKTTKCGRETGWFAFNQFNSPVFTEVGIEHVITILEQTGWKKL